MAPKSPAEMLEAIVRNLPSRTGKSLQQWVRLVRRSGPKGTKERMAWLKAEHGLGGPTARIIVAECEGESLSERYDDQVGLVEGMYSGAKADLRPIHEGVVKVATKLGPDVQVLARKTYVSLSRDRQFATIQPSTRTRVDLGLVLKGVEATGRLELAKNVGGGRVTHRIALAKKGDFDAEARKWLKLAYERGG